MPSFAPGLVRGLLLDASVIATVVLAVIYRSRVIMPRPPVGRFVWSDIAVMIVVLVVMPFAYLHLPLGLVVALFGLSWFIIMQATLAPMAGGSGAAVLALAACGLELAAAIAGWRTVLVVVNDLTIMVLTIGVANLWVQTGMKPAHIAGLAAALTVYDTLATGLSPVTAEFVSRLAGMPFAPMMVVQFGSAPTTIGLGDCLMLTVWPLAAAKVYGRRAAWLAVFIDLAVLVGILLGFLTHVVSGAVPVLTALGPLIIAQYVFWWRRASHRARTTEPAAAAGHDADQLAGEYATR